MEGGDVERSKEEGAEELPVPVLASLGYQRIENTPVQWKLGLSWARVELCPSLEPLCLVSATP